MGAKHSKKENHFKKKTDDFLKLDWTSKRKKPPLDICVVALSLRGVLQSSNILQFSELGLEPHSAISESLHHSKRKPTSLQCVSGRGNGDWWQTSGRLDL